ncbi:PilZ domain-containing protein [Photobacterium chitinilyticum]|uniref:PilZ domain-containing protein n=1 Tax=Photobacterium chitinilyticum TaxID=2485123 RepID=A0A3S4TLU3_9GAMM|nr:PilZ domain-containing protein [Photobacterium chitinilyticum]RWX55422.1 PilZ domain-containing protein [Photobacterium chitinilyticum]
MNQDEYFSVSAGLTINVELLPPNEQLPDELAFSHEIPPLFRVASECTGLEDGVEQSLNKLTKEESKPLLDYLTAQNSKINLLLSYILSQQDNPAHRYSTETFGASQLTFYSNNTFPVGRSARVKLFLDKPSAAVYCYAEIIGNAVKGDKFEITLKYNRLQENDRDLLIRAALYFQQKLLRQRAQQRTDTQ